MNKLLKNKKLVMIITTSVVILIIGILFMYKQLVKDTDILLSDTSNKDNVQYIDNTNIDSSNLIIEDIPTNEVSDITENSIDKEPITDIENNTEAESDGNNLITQEKEVAKTETTKVESKAETKAETKVESKSQSTKETPKITQSNSSQSQTQKATKTVETKKQEETTTTTKTNTTTKVEEPKQETPKVTEKVEEKTTPKCSGSNHFLGTGNTGKWFNSKQEAINYYNQTYSTWATKWENYEIDDNTFHKKCPNRYEIFQCVCGKWTIDFFYEY